MRMSQQLLSFQRGRINFIAAVHIPLKNHAPEADSSEQIFRGVTTRVLAKIPL